MNDWYFNPQSKQLSEDWNISRYQIQKYTRHILNNLTFRFSWEYMCMVPILMLHQCIFFFRLHLSRRLYVFRPFCVLIKGVPKVARTKSSSRGGHHAVVWGHALRLSEMEADWAHGSGWRPAPTNILGDTNEKVTIAHFSKTINL